MVRHTTADDDGTETTNTDDAVARVDEHADLYADDPTETAFRCLVTAMEAEYDASPTIDDDDRITDHTAPVGTPVASAVEDAANAMGYDAGTVTNFDRDDEVTVRYDSFRQDDTHATPMDLVRLAAHADAATDRTVRFRDGAGSVRIYVEVPARTPDDADDDE